MDVVVRIKEPQGGRFTVFVVVGMRVGVGPALLTFVWAHFRSFVSHLQRIVRPSVV